MSPGKESHPPPWRWRWKVMGTFCLPKKCGNGVSQGKRSYPHGEGGGGRVCDACYRKRPPEGSSPATQAVLKERLVLDLPPPGERDTVARERFFAELGAYIDRIMTNSGLPCEQVLPAIFSIYSECMYDFCAYETWNDTYDT